MPKVVLVTGGAGFIGSNLLIRNVSSRPDTRFVCLDKLTYAGDAAHLASIRGRPNFRERIVDLTDREATMEAVRDVAPDLILHLAAETHVDRSIDCAVPFAMTNVLGTVHLLDACRALVERDRRACRFHHVSTDEVYGSLDAEGSFQETSPYAPSSPYSASKAASDHFVRAYARTYGLDVSITHGSNTYGPHQNREKLIPLLIDRLMHGRPLPIYGDGTNVREWLFVTDHAEAIWLAATRGKSGESYNVGSGDERTNLDVARAVCRAFARCAGASEKDLLASIAFVEDRKGHDHRYAVDSSKLRAHTGFRPSFAFSSGLEATVRWYLAEAGGTTEEHETSRAAPMASSSSSHAHLEGRA